MLSRRAGLSAIAGLSCCQLYMILAYVNTFYQAILSGLPLVFALLPDKTQSTYETLFHHVLTQCEVNGLRTIRKINT